MADTIVHRLGMIAYPRGDLKYTMYWQISRVCCRIVTSAVIQKQTSDIASTRCVHDDKVRHSKVVFLILLLILVLYVVLCALQKVICNFDIRFVLSDASQQQKTLLISYTEPLST